jgi:hypothetical protein
LRPFIGGADAERAAVAIAPLLPLLLLMFALALTMKRLVTTRPGHCRSSACCAPIRPWACSLRCGSIITAGSWRFWRWRVGMADPRRARGGAVLGIATGLSLAIGLEMMIYLGLLGGASGLLWVADRDQSRRWRPMPARLSPRPAFSFLVFASYANRYRLSMPFLRSG